MRNFITLLALFCALPALTQASGRAMYVYRNDKTFNAFLFADVDSITYSTLGTDGKQYDDCVTQLIYTADSVYGIPLAAIDSISFVRPATVFGSDVFLFTDEHSRYLLRGDTISFVMGAGIPSGMLPKVGDVVVSDPRTTVFANGIVARVTEMRKTSEGYEFLCAKASLDDVFDQIAVVEYASNVSADPASGAHAEDSDVLWNWTSEGSGSADGVNVAANVGEQCRMKVSIVKMGGMPLQARFEISNKFESRFTLDAAGQFGGDALPFSIIEVTKPSRVFVADCPYVWFQPLVAVNGYVGCTGAVRLNCAALLNGTGRSVLNFDSGRWTFGYCPTRAGSVDIKDASMQGSAEMGLRPSLFFVPNGTAEGFGFEGKAGVKETLQFPLDTDKLNGGVAYEACKNGFCKTELPYHATVSAVSQFLTTQQTGGSMTEGHAGSETFGGTVQVDSAKYLLPLFSPPVYAQGETTAEGSVYTLLTRNVAVPVSVGLRLYGADGTLLEEHVSQETSAMCDAERFTCSFKGLEEGKSYFARPTVTLFNHTLEATPKQAFLVAPTAVDLGLSVRWAACNVGATAPEGYGNYYAWGETEEKTDYSYTNYLHYISSTDSYVDIGTTISGTKYDVAHAQWGGNWRMPTLKEMDELLNNCTFSWSRRNGVNGCVLTATNGNSIFLPATGFRDGTYVCNRGNYGFYAVGSHDTASTYDAYYLCFCTSGLYTDLYGFRRSGFAVRPVCP